MSRRRFVVRAGWGASGLLLPFSPIMPRRKNHRIKAILFDGFAIFDPGPVFRKLKELFPQAGNQMAEIWLSRQFGYQWLRITANQYRNFRALTADALQFAALACQVNMSTEEEKTILGQYPLINAWPDVAPVLRDLKSEGMTLSILSNMTAEMLHQGIRNAALEDIFDQVLSTDQKETYKPSPVAYQMGVDALHLKKDEILFVSYASWDTAGAKWFGYPTFWLNRMRQPADRLGIEPDAAGTQLEDLRPYFSNL